MILIKDNYYIDYENENYIVKKYVGKDKKTGKDLYRNLSYATTFYYALNDVLSRELGECISGQIKTLEEAITDITILKYEFSLLFMKLTNVVHMDDCPNWIKKLVETPAE